MIAAEHEHEREKVPQDEEAVRAAIAQLDARFPFGPGFFLGQLGSFVRDRCPDPAEGLPHVEVHLIGGEVLDVCHVMGIAPRWVALAVFDTEESRAAEMRTELVPFEAIVRVSVRGGRGGSARVGFRQDSVPSVRLTAEEALDAAAARRPSTHSIEGRA